MARRILSTLALVAFLGGPSCLASGQPSSEQLACECLLAEAVELSEDGFCGAAQQAWSNAGEVCDQDDVPWNLRIEWVVGHGQTSDAETAMSLYNQTIATVELRAGPYDASLGPLTAALADAQERLGDYEAALVNLERSLELRVDNFTRCSEEAAEGLVILGEFWMSRGELARAEALLREGASIGERACGPHCYTLAFAYRGLAELMRSIPGRESEAQRFDELSDQAWPASC